MGLLDLVTGALAGQSGNEGPGGPGGPGGLGGLGDLLRGAQGQGGQADLLKMVLGLLAGDGQGGGLAGKGQLPGQHPGVNGGRACGFARFCREPARMRW